MQSSENSLQITLLIPFLWGGGVPLKPKLHLSSKMLVHVVVLMRCQEEKLHICEHVIRTVVFSFNWQGKRLQEQSENPISVVFEGFTTHSKLQDQGFHPIKCSFHYAVWPIKTTGMQRHFYSCSLKNDNRF